MWPLQPHKPGDRGKVVLRSPSAQTSVDLERSFDGARGRDARKKGEKRGEESQRREKIEEAEEKREESHDKVRNRAWSSVSTRRQQVRPSGPQFPPLKKGTEDTLPVVVG